MQKVNTVPTAIVTAVNAMLDPYGINIAELTEPTSPLDQPKFISPKQAAIYASMSRFTIGRAIKAGKLAAMKMAACKSGKVLIDIDDLNKWIRSHKIKA